MNDYDVDDLNTYVKPIYTLITLSSIVTAIFNVFRKLLYYRFKALKKGHKTVKLDWNFISLNTTMF